MAESFGIKVTGVDELAKSLDKINDNLVEEVERVMLQAGEVVRGEIVKAAPASSGALRRSFVTSLIDRGKDRVSVGVFSDLPYARIQNQGGTIFPKTGKNLAIPLTRQAKKLWPRDWAPGQLMFQMRRGKKLLFDRANRLQYALKSSVTLKGSGYLDTAAKNSKDDVAAVLADGLEDFMKKNIKGV